MAYTKRKKKMRITNEDGHHNAWPRGHYNNPIRTDRPLTEMEYPVEFMDRSHIYAVPPGGEVTKWYRSYADYCA
jgi:hypothetical protein